MRILITGAAGFLGSNLFKYFRALGHDVWGVDDYSTGAFMDDNIHKWNVVSGMPNKLYRSYDWILHFASAASPIHYKKEPIKTLTTNGIGTYRYLRYAQELGAKFLVASTSEIYGDPLVHPQPESYYGNVNPIGERSCYDEGKRYAEAMTMAFTLVDTRIIRIFNTYGPGMRTNDGRVMPNFIDQAKRGAPLTIYGDGRQTRSFCHVNDLVKGIHMVMDKGDKMPYNIGNPHEITMNDLADIILEVTGSKSKKAYLPIGKDDPTRRKPVIDRIKSLGWIPEIDIYEGIKTMI